MFNGPMFTADEIENLNRLKESKENERNELSHAKRLLSRLERIQKLEHDDRTLDQIADEWTAQAQEMINQQEKRIKTAVINDKEKKQQIREACAFYVQEINAINFLKSVQ